MEIGWSDPTLTLAGENWSLSLTCPWTVSALDRVAFTHQSPDVEDQAWDLVGLTLTKVVPRSHGDFVDPVFEFSNGLRLQVLSDTGMDPWSMHLDELVFIGPLKKEDWA